MTVRDQRTGNGFRRIDPAIRRSNIETFALDDEPAAGALSQPGLLLMARGIR
jgi:hypothetical protein